MDVRSTDRTDLTRRLEPLIKPAGKSDDHASRPRDSGKDGGDERRDDQELEIITSESSHILDVKV